MLKRGLPVMMNNQKDRRGERMRDVKRIPPFMEKLSTYWQEVVPDWRFGQLMSNFLGYVYQETGRDIFFIEESEMECLMDRYFQSKG